MKVSKMAIMALGFQERELTMELLVFLQISLMKT